MTAGRCRSCALRQSPPVELYELLLQHGQTQLAERAAAGSEWHDGDWMFAQLNGKPIDPTADRNDWLELLDAAGVRRARLHDARHTAATVLLLLGVDQRVTMALMGWSSVSMLKRYQHVLDTMEADVANRLGGLLWGDGSQ